MEIETQNNGNGIKCDCGHFEKFGLYVHAHWNDILTYTCEKCGNKCDIRRGDILSQTKKESK